MRLILCDIHSYRKMADATSSLKDVLGPPLYVDMWETWHVLPNSITQNFDIFITCIYVLHFIVFIKLMWCRYKDSPESATDFLEDCMSRYLAEQDCKDKQAALIEDFAATEYTRNARCIRICRPYSSKKPVHLNLIFCAQAYAHAICTCHMQYAYAICIHNTHMQCE